MIIYFLIAFCASTLGAIIGIGGGLIIKPTLGAITSLTLGNINLLSSLTIFSMAITSLIKRKLNKSIIFIKNVQWLILGSITGGFIGNQLFNYFLQTFNNIDNLDQIQSTIIIILLIIAFSSKYLNQLIGDKINLKLSKTNLFLIGIWLATISSFLAVGGGPANVAMLVILFKVDIKSATFTSILLILFSQGTNLVTTLITQQYLSYHLAPALIMIPGGIIGGIVGTKINNLCTAKAIEIIFSISMICLIILNIFNIYL